MPAGVTAIDTSVAFVTVRLAVPVMVPEVAVIVTVPAATPVASPWVEAPLLIVALVASDELQVTVLVTLFTLPSL